MTWFALIFSVCLLAYSLKAHRDARRDYKRALEAQTEAMRRLTRHART